MSLAPSRLWAAEIVTMFDTNGAAGRSRELDCAVDSFYSPANEL